MKGQSHTLHVVRPEGVEPDYLDTLRTGFNLKVHDSPYGLLRSLAASSNQGVLFHLEKDLSYLHPHMEHIQKAKLFPLTVHVPVINSVIRKAALEQGYHDIFDHHSSAEDISLRLKYLLEHPIDKLGSKEKKFKNYRMPIGKRLFDIVVSLIALTLLSPFMLLIALLIMVESKGPVFYYALRVGTGYQTFKFYKFRSMYPDADKRLKDLQHLNQYASEKNDSEERVIEVVELEADADMDGLDMQGKTLFMDGKALSEEEYKELKKQNAGSKFIKIKDDPRVTKVGMFIRNTSLDELPQLWNVLKGDMSIVGNRPLPIYEAEKLTTDRFSMRFLAPAGITGLWQVTKRGKGGKMSDEERMELDNAYARNYSFFRDLLLILKTIPALLQKENV